MGLLSSMINVVKSVGYLLTGNMDDLAVMWSSNPAAIRAKGAGAVKGMQNRLAAIAKALGPQHVQVERYKGQIKVRQDRLAQIPGLINGAMATIQKITDQKGLTTKEQAAADPEIIKYLKLNSELKDEFAKKTKEVSDFNDKIAGAKNRIAKLEMQGSELKKKIENAGAEVEDTVAAVISSREEQKANAAFTGLGKDTSQADLDDLRKIREKAEGDAAAARSLAGMEVSSIETELMEAGAAFNSLDALNGIRFTETEETPATPAQVEKLPEH